MPPIPSTRLIVGIDFGTTFSGVAYAVVQGEARPTNINVISQWRGVKQMSTYERVKVPTKIVYDPAGKIHWGYEVPDDGDAIEWFKLLLVEEKDLSEKLRGSNNTQVPRKKLDDLDKDVLIVVSDYLRQLWEYALTHMERTLGAVAEVASLSIVLTVPAIWPEYARNTMLKAAKLAGICEDRVSGKTVIQLVPEPEAAAIATICTVVPDRPDIDPGDSVVILDIGGGTADAISYTVDKVKPFPQFREVVEGDGSFHGAKLLDREFEDYIKMYIGLQNWERYSKFHSRILNESWEYSIKPSFDNTDRQWIVDTIIDGKVDLNKEQIADCFEKSVMPGIKELVKSQIELIKKATHAPPKVRHKAQNETFDPDQHSVEDRYWDEGRGEYMASNQVHWPIKRGQELADGQYNTSYVIMFLPTARGYNKHKAYMYKSILQDPPTRINKDLAYSKNESVADGVEFLGKIAVKTPVSVEDLPKRKNAQDKEFPTFEWTWDIRVSGRSVEMIATTSDGAKVGELVLDDVMK
ncbi:hypothetical protein SLS62_004651 [Diatrype stigma]|uniref:Actin-like ATPase domain-containing protein n=1 Tax=Diatrype stigma TaxID=117547 RepID=A0AAN9UTZ0_9PEZI